MFKICKRFVKTFYVHYFLSRTAKYSYAVLKNVGNDFNAERKYAETKLPDMQ